MIVRIARKEGRDAVFDAPPSLMARGTRDSDIDVALSIDPAIAAKGRVREGISSSRSTDWNLQGPRRTERSSERNASSDHRLLAGDARRTSWYGVARQRFVAGEWRAIGLGRRSQLRNVSRSRSKSLPNGRVKSSYREVWRPVTSS